MAKVYCDGKIMDVEKASVPLMDRGLLFGEGAFETLRSYDYRYFRLNEHIERFFRNLELLRITLKMGAEEIRQALRETVRADGEKDARIKFIATAGVEGGVPSFYIHTSKLIPFPDDLYKRGARLITSTLTRNERNITTTIKALSYLDSVWARQESLLKGGDEGLFINMQGHVSEGASSNLFIVKDDVLATPSLDQGVLPGVTRSFVLELARFLGIKTREGVVSPGELAAADEVFITASVKEVMPVALLDGKVVGKTRILTDRLRIAYKEKIREQCKE
jgi:branched-subunit amino acid aminotransferase/4-amino-4-deoxychorismate lyase